MRRRALLLTVLATALACDRGQIPGRAPEAIFRGVLLSPAIEKPDVTFTDFNGEPYNLRLKTAGKVALLFFGYTHCPDVCPLHAANVAAVLKSMPFEERAKIQFLFVTTDPERDTPARLREWLGAFDPGFVGLTAPTEGLARLQASLGVAPSKKEAATTGDSAKYLVGHGAQVLAFGLDNFARVEYPFGIRQEDWANDLPRLARGDLPTPTANAAQGAGERPTEPASVPAAPTIDVRVALMAAPVTTTEASVYLVLRNNGHAADTLTNVWSPDATGSMIHRTERDGGAMRMVAVDAVPVAAGGTLEFLPGATHVMLTGLSRKPVPGESFPLRLRFAKAGEFIFAPLVVAYADVDARLAAAR